MKNKKLFINGLSSFVIMGGFLSPSYSVFAMKRSTKMTGSPKMKRSTKMTKITSKRLPKNQKTEFDSNMDPSKRENNNSKQVCYSKLKEMNDSTFNRYADLFKDKNFEELVLSKDDFQALEKTFHIMVRMVYFDQGQDVFFKKFMGIDTTVCQQGVLFTVCQKDKLDDEVSTLRQEFDLLKEILSKNQKHKLLFPSHVEQDNDNLIPVSQEISMRLFLLNVASLVESLNENIQDNNLCVEQLIKTKLLFFIYATGLYFFYKINTIKQEDLPPPQLKRLLYIPIFINKIKQSFNIDNLFHTDLKLTKEWIHDFCGDTVIINRLDPHEQRLLKNISQHLEARYRNFLAQYDLNNIDIPSTQFIDKLKQLLSSKKSELLGQFLSAITYPLISLLRHFKDSGFVFFAGKDIDGTYVCMNLQNATDLPLFAKRAGFLTEALSVKDDSLITKTIAAMEDILRFIPVTFRIIESEKDIDPNQNFSFYKFSQNAGISKQDPKFSISITGSLCEKQNKVLETITEKELKDLELKINSLIKGGDGHLSRSLDDLQWNVNTLNKDFYYYSLSFSSISDFKKYLDDILDSFLKLKKDVDIIESVVKSRKQIKDWQSQYRSIPSDLKGFFYDIHSNILSINKNLEECLNQLQDQDFLIDTEWINNIMDQQKKLDETIQDFKAKKKLIDTVSTLLNPLRCRVGILRNKNTNISKDIATITNPSDTIGPSNEANKASNEEELNAIDTKINTLESAFFKSSLNEEELKNEVSSLQRELDGIEKKLEEGKVKKSYMSDQSLNQSLKAQNEVVKYNKNQIFFVNSKVKKDAGNYIKQNGIYKEGMDKFIQSLGDGSINSDTFYATAPFLQNFAKTDHKKIIDYIKDYDIQYVEYKEQNGQNSSLRILYGINKEKGIVIIFYVGAPFHEGSRASTLSIRNFIEFALQPLE